MAKHLLSLDKLTQKEVTNILDMAKRVKKNKGLHKDLLKARTIGLLFQKPSNRESQRQEQAAFHRDGGPCRSDF